MKEIKRREGNKNEKKKKDEEEHNPKMIKTVRKKNGE